MKKQPLYILALLAWGAASAHAQNLQPGLWEMHTRSGAGDAGMVQGMAEMQKQMAQMPPEQRKQMQAMSLQEQAAEIVHGAKRKPKGGYNF